MREEKTELADTNHCAPQNGNGHDQHKDRLCETILDVGRRLKELEDSAKARRQVKNLGFEERIEIEKDIKSQAKSMFETFFPETDLDLCLKTQIWDLAITDDDPSVTLECLRCFLWLLKTSRVVPDLQIVDRCLEVADGCNAFPVLLYTVKTLHQLAAYDSPRLAEGRGMNDNVTILGTLLSDLNGAARIALSLRRAVPMLTKEKLPDLEFIADQLNQWFIFVQRKLLCPVAKKDVKELIDYFTTLLLTEDSSIHLGLVIRNILVNLLNFQSDKVQGEYISSLVKAMGSPGPDLKMLRKKLELLRKLAGRGRCAIIRHSENGAILEDLVKLCLLMQDKDKLIVKIALHLVIMLYESPHYIKEHNVLKTNQFIQFLTSNAGDYDGNCTKILKFLIFNDPNNSTLKTNILTVSQEKPSLRECPTFYQVLSVAKAKASYRHKCEKIQLLTYPTLVWFIFSYSKDTFLDLCIAINGIIFRANFYTLSWALLGFAVFPLLICNIASLNNFYSTTPLSVTVSLEGHYPRYRILKYITPWRFDTKKHALFNMLTILQLHPAIMVIDIISHHAQPVGNILNSQYNLKKLNNLETMLENIPCLAIKVVTIAGKFQSGRFKWSNWGNIFEMITLTNSVFSLSKSALDFESICRFVDNGRWQIQLLSQKAAIFLGYLSMIGARMLMFLILTRFNDWIFGFTVFIHVAITFSIQLFTYHIKAEKDGDLDEHFVFLRKFDWRLIPFVLSEGFLVLLRSPMEYLGVYSHYRYMRKRWLFFLIYFIHWIEVVTVNLCYIFQVLAKDPENFVRYRAMFIISLLSIGFHFVAGLWFTFYFFVCSPKKKGTFKFVPENKRSVLYNGKEEHDYDWREKMCLKVEQVHTINGKKVPKIPMRPTHSSSSFGDNRDFEREYKTQLDEEERVFRAYSEDDTPPPKNKPKFKIKSLYVKI